MAAVVGEWHMDEGAGSTAADSSGNGLTATLAGTNWTTGIIRNALTFNGVDSYMEVAHNSTLEPASVTVEAWVKLTADGTRHIILEKWAGYTLEVASDGVPYFQVFNGSQLGTTSPSAISFGAWHHLVGTYNASSNNISIYVDGALKASATVVGPISYGSGVLRVSAPQFGGGAVNGQVDEARVYSHVLTATEVRQHFYCGAGRGTYNWQGISANYSDSRNWDCRSVPRTNDSVLLNASAPNQPVMSDSNAIYNITTASGTTLTLNPGVTLTFDDASGAGFQISTAGGKAVFNGNATNGVTVKSTTDSPTNKWSVGNVGGSQTMSTIANYTTIKGTNQYACWSAVCIFNNTVVQNYTAGNGGIYVFNVNSTVLYNVLVNKPTATATGITFAAFGPNVWTSGQNVTVKDGTTGDVVSGCGGCHAHLELSDSVFNGVTLGASDNFSVTSKNHRNVANAYGIWATKLKKSEIIDKFGTGQNVTLYLGSLLIDEAAAAKAFNISTGTSLNISAGRTLSFDDAASAGFTSDSAGTLRTEGISGSMAKITSASATPVNYWNAIATSLSTFMNFANVTHYYRAFEVKNWNINNSNFETERGFVQQIDGGVLIGFVSGGVVTSFTNNTIRDTQAHCLSSNAIVTNIVNATLLNCGFGSGNPQDVHMEVSFNQQRLELVNSSFNENKVNLVTFGLGSNALLVSKNHNNVAGRYLLWVNWTGTSYSSITNKPDANSDVEVRNLTSTPPAPTLTIDQQAFLHILNISNNVAVNVSNSSGITFYDAANAGIHTPNEGTYCADTITLGFNGLVGRPVGLNSSSTNPTNGWQGTNVGNCLNLFMNYTIVRDHTVFGELAGTGFIGNSVFERGGRNSAYASLFLRDLSTNNKYVNILIKDSFTRGLALYAQPKLFNITIVNSSLADVNRDYGGDTQATEFVNSSFVANKTKVEFFGSGTQNKSVVSFNHSLQPKWYFFSRANDYVMYGSIQNRFRYTDDASVIVGNLIINQTAAARSLNVSAGATVNVTSSLQLTSGFLEANGTVNVSGSGVLTLLNSTYSTGNLTFSSNGTLFKKWFVDVKVVYSNGTAASGASVTIRDVFTNAVFSGTTNSTGFTTQQNLTQTSQNATGFANFTPYAFSASQGGASTTSSVVVDSSRLVTLTLNYPPGRPTLLTPANGSESSDTTPFFDWTDVTDPDGDTVKYDLALSNGTLPWWNSSWAYRTPIKVQNLNTTDQVDTNFSVKLTYDHQVLVTAGKALSNGNDVRVVVWDGADWAEVDRVLNASNASSADLYFRLQNALAASATNDSYYMYYGYPSAGTPPTEPENVFYFYDDFDDGNTNGWTAGTPSWYVVGGELEGSSMAGDAHLYSSTSLPANVVVEATVRNVNFSSTTSWVGIHVRKTTASDFYSPAGSGYLAIIRINGELDIFETNPLAARCTTNVTYSPGVNNTFRVVAYGDNITAWFNNQLRCNFTDSTPYTGGAFSVYSGTSTWRFDNITALRAFQPEPNVSRNTEEALVLYKTNLSSSDYTVLAAEELNFSNYTWSARGVDSLGLPGKWASPFFFRVRSDNPFFTTGPSISPAYPSTLDDLNCTWVASDPNPDDANLTVSVNVFENGVYNSTWSVTSMTCASNRTCGLASPPRAADTSVDDTFVCQVIVRDRALNNVTANATQRVQKNVTVFYTDNTADDFTALPEEWATSSGNTQSTFTAACPSSLGSRYVFYSTISTNSSKVLDRIRFTDESGGPKLQITAITVERP
jgi:hypothetical protein